MLLKIFYREFKRVFKELLVEEKSYCDYEPCGYGVFDNECYYRTYNRGDGA